MFNKMLRFSIFMITFVPSSLKTFIQHAYNVKQTYAEYAT